MIRFQDPELLLVLFVIPLLVYRYFIEQNRRKGSIRYSDISVLKAIRPSWSLKLRHLLIALRALGLAALILAFVRPQSGRASREMLTEGVDIVLTVDVSGSMEAKDLDENRKIRLEVCKEVVADFIKTRSNDRIGMVVFAGESFTQCPLTLDYGVLLNFLRYVQILMRTEDGTPMIEDGTAIGTAIANSVNRLRETKAKSKVIVLLTDGVNNRGEIDPLTAADAGAALGIKIYTIGAGSEGTIMQRVDGFLGSHYVPVRVEIDEETLRKIADITGGRYYRATSEEKLKQIYQEIGELEKTEIKTKEHIEYTELFQYFLWPGLALLLIEVVLGNTRFRRIP